MGCEHNHHANIQTNDQLVTEKDELFTSYAVNTNDSQRQITELDEVNDLADTRKHSRMMEIDSW
jgi:hypothetical protein